jgi:hypothetical protein
MGFLSAFLETQYLQAPTEWRKAQQLSHFEELK